MLTTLEMDGLITEQDISNRNHVVFQCKNCRSWNVHRDFFINQQFRPCSECKIIDYDLTSGKSIRTYDPLIDKKRKPKIAKKR